MENGPASILAMAEPVVATLLGIFAFSEIPSASGWIGIGMVFLALALLTVQKGGGQTERQKEAG